MDEEQIAERFKEILTELGVDAVDAAGARLLYFWYTVYRLVWLVKRFFIIFSYIAIVFLVLNSEFKIAVSNAFKIALLIGLFFVFLSVYLLQPYYEGQKVVSMVVKLINNYPEHYRLKEDEEDGGDPQ